MERTIPYFRDVILPESVAQNRTVLIASSENAIRGLLMHLCEIPSDRISEIEIPTGVPLIYDAAGQCVHLFDDGVSPQPRDRYDFGKGADLLFRPCVGDDDEGCLVHDPHLYLDDSFWQAEDKEHSRHFAERERQGLIDAFDEAAADEFSVEKREFWADPKHSGEYDEEPADVEI
jgi:hypothetical protein